MHAEVFERLLSLNRGLEQVIADLKSLESVKEFDQGSIELYTRNAEDLKAGVNRYVAEMIIADADRESVRLDAQRPPAEREEEEEP